MSQTHKSMHRVHMDGVMEKWKDRNWEGDGKVRDKEILVFSHGMLWGMGNSFCSLRGKVRE